MKYPLELQKVGEGDTSFWLAVPVAAEVERIYKRAKESGENPAFPYWAKVWPAAVGLSRFIVENPELVAGKLLLELAAGVGMPGMQASFYARHIVCSDYDEDAVQAMQESISTNGFTNVEAVVMNWNTIPQALQPELVLLSDINYEPAVFDELYSMLLDFKQRGIPIILSTPQRLMAKPFIERVLPHCTRHEVRMVDEHAVSILVL